MAVGVERAGPVDVDGDESKCVVVGGDESNWL